MKNQEITSFSIEELQSKIAAERNTVRNLRFAHSVSPLENPKRISQSKKTLARLLTELSNRESK